MRAIFICPLPPTLNEQIELARANKFKSATTKKEWDNIIQKLVIKQQIPRFPDKIWMFYEWRIKNFGRDPDNICGSAKYVNDGLKKAGVIVNDSLKYIYGYDQIFTKWKEDELKLTISDKPILKKIFIEDDSNATP